MNKAVSYIFYLLIYLIPLTGGITLFASDMPVADSSSVVVRQPDAGFIDSYKSQKEFVYVQQPPLETNFLKRLIKYIQRKLKAWEHYTTVMPLLFKILMWASIIFFLFVVITKTKLYKLFYTDQEIKNPDFVIADPDEQIVDFDEAIRLQIEQLQYRQAVRLLYIKLINRLRVNNFIHYSKEKTNRDYLRDLTNEELKSGFYTITSIYNYVWYGDIEIEKDQFLRFEKSFQSFYSTIDEQK